jgi:lambda family phage portal protein
MLEGGDCVGAFWDIQDGSKRGIKMRLKLYEGDFVDDGRNGPIDGGRARLGVGLGDQDVRTGLWMFSDHPGEASLGSGAARSTFVPRTNLIHLYRPLRIGQVRGVPVFAPVLMAARDYADLMDALVVKARVEACQALVVTRPEGAGTLAGSTVDDGSGPVEKVRPGTVLYLNPGEQATSFNPASSGGYDQVQIQTLMGIASGAMVTYDQLTGDLRQANYSSLRAGKIEFRRIVEQLQWLVVVPKLIEPVVERFLDRAKLARIIDRLPQGCGCQFVMPAVEPIDPEKDLKADILAVRAGRMSPQEFISGWGRDWREVVDDMEAFFKVADEKGLIFDLDPRKVSAAGIVQPEPAAQTGAS